MHSVESNINFSQYDYFHCKGLTFLFLNARSLIPQISNFILSVNCSKAAIGYTCETWLDNLTDYEIKLDGYNVIH